DDDSRRGDVRLQALNRGWTARAEISQHIRGKAPGSERLDCKNCIRVRSQKITKREPRASRDEHRRNRGAAYLHVEDGFAAVRSLGYVLVKDDCRLRTGRARRIDLINEAARTTVWLGAAAFNQRNFSGQRANLAPSARPALGVDISVRPLSKAVSHFD